MLFSIVTFLLGQKYLNKTFYEPKKKTDTKIYDIKKIIKELSEREKNRLLVLFFVFMALCVFFTAFEQSAGLLNLYTKNYTNRNIFNIEIPTSMFQSLNPFFVIIFAPLISSF
jgi:POT family proton-dependent oligopeptide transporter